MTADQILEDVARENGATVDELKGPGKSQRLFLIRAQAVRRLRGHRGRKRAFKLIGELLGGRNHTSVRSLLHGGKKKKHA